jgi:hypothetical protein
VRIRDRLSQHSHYTGSDIIGFDVPFYAEKEADKPCRQDVTAKTGRQKRLCVRCQKYKAVLTLVTSFPSTPLILIIYFQHYTLNHHISNNFFSEMYALTLLITAVGMVAAAPSTEINARQVAQVASVDRYAGGGCTGTICVRANNTQHTVILISYRTSLVPVIYIPAATSSQMRARPA